MANFVSKYFQYFFANKELKKTHDTKIAQELLLITSEEWFAHIIDLTISRSFERKTYDFFRKYLIQHSQHKFYNNNIQKQFDLFVESLKKYKSLL